jgi:hypothetical protein
MKKLTAAYWIKDEARYLPEYLEFHLLQGFDYFIFYDNKSTDNTKEVLASYIDEGLVELREYPPHITTRNNFWLMSHLIDELKGKTEWLHFHAIDERIFNPNGEPLPLILEQFNAPEIAGVCVCWEQIHSGGLVNRKDGLIIENFRDAQIIDTMKHIKTIIKPDKTLSNTPDTPHNFYTIPNTNTVDENFNIVHGPFNHNNYSMEKIKNLHYVTLSSEEFNNKMNKGVLDHAGMENNRRPNADHYWDFHHQGESKKIYDLDSYIPIIKANLLKRFGNTDLLQYINY